MSTGPTFPILSNVLDEDIGRYLQDTSDAGLMGKHDDALRAPGVRVITDWRDHPVEYQIAHDQVSFRPPCMRVKSFIESLIMLRCLTWGYQG